MGRKFIATILSAALAVTAISAPAKADNQDIVKFLAGATALVIIGKAIQDSKKDDDKAHYVHRRDNRWDDRNRHDRNERHDNRRDRWDNHGRLAMPANCRVNVNTRHGTVSGYAYDCVQRDRRLARALPGQCVTNTRSRRGPDFIYTSQCLARNGVRVH